MLYHSQSGEGGRMKSTQKLLRTRARMKAHQPLFVVKEYHKSARVKMRWRAQRGIHSGHRQMHRGKPAQPTPGFGVPKAVRGLHSSGLQPVLVHSVSQLDAVDVQTQGIVIGATVGMRKKMHILDAAVKKNLTILQKKDAPSTLEHLRSSFALRVKVKKDRISIKTKKEAEKSKRADEKKKEEEQKKKESSSAPTSAKTGEKESSIDDAVSHEKSESGKEKKVKEQLEAEKTIIKPH